MFVLVPSTMQTLLHYTEYAEQIAQTSFIVFDKYPEASSTMVSIKYYTVDVM